MVDDAGVREVSDSSQVPFCHFNGDGKEFIQDYHRIWNIHNLIVFTDFCDEVTWV